MECLFLCREVAGNDGIIFSTDDLFYINGRYRRVHGSVDLCTCIHNYVLYVCVRACVCMCVCVGVGVGVCVYVCVCVCVCVCVL